ncbi:lipoprotein insertase outer membrane protein LolB [Pseudoalteromonas sp. '520P1 No. 412']|uniref:lipoprotein insertase outer membrane protein LolB n=2 Tax=unclassified Pseudoalteromonas TaxID=194690 RepID=UPI0009E18A31|nr:lipoprotein insertase outer membrane protein LolB [Pseudoalteromonas sp. '520P1 No. 412']
MRLYLILLMFFLFISGCVSTIPDKQTIFSDWQVHLDNQDSWKANGKLAFISKKERHSANFTWQNNGGSSTPDYKLKLTTFIGTQILSLVQTNSHAQLDYDSKTFRDKNAQNMLNRLTDLSFPLNDAPNWLKGRPDSAHIKYDNFERIMLATIEDSQGDTWQVTYNNYVKNNGVWLPTKLNLERNDLKIKMQIHSWQFN